MTYIHRDPIEQHKNNNYWSILYNKIPQDNRLSLAAKGLHWYLITRAPAYKVSKKRLLKELTAEKAVSKRDKQTKKVTGTRTMRKDSRCSIETAFDELVDAGYIANEKGAWHVYETSKGAENQQVQKISTPTTTDAENQHQQVQKISTPTTTDAENQHQQVQKISPPDAENQPPPCRKSASFTSVVRIAVIEGDKEGGKDTTPLSSSSPVKTETESMSNDASINQDQQEPSKVNKQEQHEQASFLRNTRTYLRQRLGHDKIFPDAELITLMDQAKRVLHEYPSPDEYQPNKKQTNELLQRIMYVIIEQDYELILATVQSYCGKKWPNYWFHEEDEDNYTEYLDEGRQLLDEQKPVVALTSEQIAEQEAQKEAERQAEEAETQRIRQENDARHLEQARQAALIMTTQSTNGGVEQPAKQKPSSGVFAAPLNKATAMAFLNAIDDDPRTIEEIKKEIAESLKASAVA